MTSNRTPFLILLLWAVWLSAEAWVFGPHSHLHLHDQADQEVPNTVWLTRSVDRVLDAELLPSMCGVARKPCTAWINSSQPLFLTLPPWLALGFFTLLQRLVGGWFAFLAARDLFRLPPWLALAAGLLYPLLPGEHGEVRLMHQFNEPGFPLFLWAFARLPADRSFSALLCGAGLGVIAGLGMGPVDAMPFLLPGAVIAGAMLRDDLTFRSGPWRGFLLAVTACAVVAVLIKLPTLLAMADHAGGSHRAAWTAIIPFADELRHHLAGRGRFLIAFWPFTLLTLVFVARRGGRTPPERALLLLLGAGVVLGPVLQSVLWQLQDHLGPLRGFDVTRFNRLAPFAFLIAALSGLRNLLDRRVPVSGTTGASPAHALAFAALAGLALHASWTVKTDHWAEMRRGWTWHGLYGGADVAALAARAEKSPAAPFRCATAGAFHEYHPLYLLANDLETADGYAVIYPDRYRRYWAQVLRPLLLAEPESADYFTRWGSRAYLFHSMRPEAEALPALPFAQWYDLDLLSLANVRFLVSRKPLDDPRLQLLPPAWDEAARDAWADRPLTARLRDYAAGRNPGPRQYVYENPAALPRFFLAEGTRIIDSPDALGDASLADLSASVFLLRDDAAGLADTPPGDGPPGELSVSEYSLERSVLQVSIKRPCWVVNTSLWYSGSRCGVDLREADVKPAYGTFQAVRLTPGEHRIIWLPGPKGPSSP